MENKILNTIKEYNLIKQNDNVIVGVSGGPDSMFLLHILSILRRKISFNIIVCHINHGTRGKETDKDEEFVRKYSNDNNLKFYSKRVDMNGYAKEKNISSEEAGRELRYDFFRHILNKYDNKGSIAVAHNKNDQAETMIMRFLRGTGIDGLKGMNFKSNDIIRPILNIKREEIENYISERNIKVRIDKTNEMDIYRRNKIRLNLIPEIKNDYNPAIIDTLYKTSRIMDMDSNFLNNYAHEKFNRIKKKQSKDYISLNISKFNGNHKAIQYRIIRLAILDVRGHLKEIDQIHIENIITLIGKNITGKKIDLPNDLEAYIDYDYIKIRLKKEKMKLNFNFKLNFDEVNYIEELDLEIDIKIINEKIKPLIKKDMFIKYFDYDKIEDGLYVRFRKPGDKFKPFGMKGNKKLKDFFIDEKISRDKREKTPLICDNKGILWVVGNRISEDYKIDSNTSKILKISIKNRG